MAPSTYPIQTVSKQCFGHRIPQGSKSLPAGPRCLGQASVVKEKRQLERWAAEIRHVRLNKLGPGHLDAVLVKLSNAGLSGRTVNLYVIAARNLIKAAAPDRHCQRPLPFEGIVWRKWDRKSRSLVTPEEIDRLVNAAVAHLPRRGRDFAEYVRFLQFTACREKEALAIRWGDIDWQREVVTIGARGESKNRSPRHLPMNPKLRRLLGELTKRRAPDSDLLFPSPRLGDDGEEEAAGGSFRAALGKARLKARLPKFGFHDLRHHFASHAVMGGVDFATLARWLGHRDGGALLARTYAHMTDSHERQLADRARSRIQAKMCGTSRASRELRSTTFDQETSAPRRHNCPL